MILQLSTVVNPTKEKKQPSDFSNNLQPEKVLIFKDFLAFFENTGKQPNQPSYKPETISRHFRRHTKPVLDTSQSKILQETSEFQTVHSTRDCCILEGSSQKLQFCANPRQTRRTPSPTQIGAPRPQWTPLPPPDAAVDAIGCAKL